VVKGRERHVQEAYDSQSDESDYSDEEPEKKNEPTPEEIAA